MIRSSSLVGSPTQSQSNPNEVVVLPGHGDGALLSALPLGVDALSVAAADLDSDGNVDVVAGAPYGPGSADVRILLGNGDGTFQPPTVLTTAFEVVASVLALDLNADAVLDLVVGTAGTDVSVFMGQGDGSFVDAGRFGVGVSSLYVFAADFNEDAWIDIASVGMGDAEIAVLFQLPTRMSPVPLLGGVGAARLAAAMGSSARRRLRR